MKKVFSFIIVMSMLFLGISCSKNGNQRTGGINGGGIQSEASVEQEKDSVVIPVSKVDVSKRTQTLHVFIENSGSMNGYINTVSDFQVAIGDALQYMQMSKKANKKPTYDTIKTYYINQNVREQVRGADEDIYQFVQKMLSRDQFRTSGTGKKDAGTASTDLNEIVKTILGKVDENNTAILISDCIYSVDMNKKGVTPAKLAGCSSLTMRYFEATASKLSPVCLATNIIQLYSPFDGNYWTWDKPTGPAPAHLRCPRPYYICVMGTDDNVKVFNRSIRVEKLKGYANQFTISNKDVSVANYTVMDTWNRKGKYRHGKEESVHSISNVSKTSAGELEFAIGIDLSDFSMSESDKVDVANYEITKGNYCISKIVPIDSTILAPADKILVRNNHCTHAIILTCTGFPNDLSISVKRDIPKWIRESSSSDDSDIDSDVLEQRKTFGISYFVEGIAKAYQYMAEDDDNFMTMNVKVNN